MIHTPVAGQQFEYNFDDIGNRTSTKAGGDTHGQNLRLANYGAIDLIGTAKANATITVNNRRADRHGTYFRDELFFDNSTNALWPSLTFVAVLNHGTSADTIATNTGNLFLPQTPEVFFYDADGNLTSDGRWTNHWDAANRLISMESLTNGPAGSKLKLLFGYDYQGRRISKTVSNWTGTAWTLVSDQRFAYDGWNLIATLTPALSVQTSFMWGLDLSGSLQGAGGVGGLLLVTDHSSPVTGSFTCYDGNGNVVALVDASNSTITGQYEYGPFGETIRLTGTAASANPFHFSTKYTDSETDLLYYGCRYYNPSIGRWLSRDPLQEIGGVNLYSFSGNDTVNENDYLGLNVAAYAKDLWENGFAAANYRLKIDLVLEAAVAGSALQGRSLTAEFLAHYLEATGTPITLTSDQVFKIRSDPYFSMDEKQNIASILSRNAYSSELSYFDYKHTHVFDKFGPDATMDQKDLFSAFHEMYFYDNLDGCVSKTSTAITFKGDLTLEVTDNYNFSNPDHQYAKRTPFNTVSWLPDWIREITEEKFRQLELHGYTKRFDVKGTIKQKVTITVPLGSGAGGATTITPAHTYGY